MEELKSQDINVEGLLNGSTVNNAVDNTVKDMEDEIKIAASELLEYKSSFEDKLANRIRDIEAQIQDKEDTVKRLKEQLKIRWKTILRPNSASRSIRRIRLLRQQCPKLY